MKTKFSRGTFATLLGCALALPMAVQAGANHVAAKQIQNETSANHAQIGQAAAPSGDLLQAANQSGSFDTWLSAVEKAGLKDMLKSGKYTVFAPTDDAFAKLPAGTLESWYKDTAKLQAVLKNHIVPQSLKAGDIPLGTVRSLAGTALDVEANRRHTLKVEGAALILPDVIAVNGVMHGIDQVILAN